MIVLLPIFDPWSHRFAVLTNFVERSSVNAKIILLTTREYSDECLMLDERFIEVDTVRLNQRLAKVLHNSFKINGDHSYSRFYYQTGKWHAKVAYTLLKLFKRHRVYSFLSKFFLAYDISQALCELGVGLNDHLVYCDASPYNASSIGVVKFLEKRKFAKSVFILPSWDNIYKWETFDYYNDYIVWGPAQKSYLESMHSENSISISGCPNSWNIIRQPIPKCVKRVLYTTIGHRHFRQEKQFVMELYTLLMQAATDFHLHIRVHPYDYADWTNFDGLDGSSVSYANTSMTNMTSWALPKNYYDGLNNAFSNCDLVVNMASTITLDAIIAGKYVLNVMHDSMTYDFYQFDHYIPITQSGKIPILSSSNELFEEICKFERAPQNVKLEMIESQREAGKELVDMTSTVDDLISLIL